MRLASAKNFFTFGEVWTANSEPAISNFIGRNTNDGGDLVGVDAALDYPLSDFAEISGQRLL